MPALGASPRQIREAAARPAPRLAPAPAPRPQVPNYVEVHAPRPSRPTWSSLPPSHPFAAAQHQAAQRVARAQAQLPQERIYAPHLPALANPTMGQQYAAFGEAKRLQSQYLGPNPTRSAELAFHRQLMADPRNAQFVQALAHYLHAARGTAGPFQAGASEGGARNVIDAAVSAANMIGPNERMKLEAQERQFQREGQEDLAREAQHRREHAGDIGLGFATINPEKLVGALANIKIPGADVLGAPGKAINEIFDLPGQTLLAGAIEGGRFRKQLEGGHVGSAFAQLPKAFGEGVASAATHPLAHPISNALMLAAAENLAGGAVGVAGRGLARAGLLPASTFARAAPDIALYGEGQLVPRGEGEGFVHGQVAPREGIRIAGRRYSRDPLRAGLQAAFEKRAYQPRTLPSGEQVLQATGKRLQRHVAGGTFKVGTVDIAQGAAQRTRVGMVRGTVNRLMQPQREKGGRLIGVRPKQGAEAVPMLVENAVRGPEKFAQDLEAELARLREAAKATDAEGNPELVGPNRTANNANVKLLEGLLNDKKLLAHVKEKGVESEPYRAAARVKAIQKPLEAMLVRGGKLLPEQLRAALFAYAQNHMGARYFTAADHEAAVTNALGEGRTLADAERYGGRDPVEVEYHSHLEGERDRAAQGVREAQRVVARAKTRLDNIIGGQRSARARGVLQGARASTSREQRVLAERRGAYLEARAKLGEAQARSREAHQAVQEHKLPDRRPGLRGPHGEVLTTEQILAHMRDEGLTPPGYISHVRGVSGRGSFYRSVSRQPSLEHFARTGVAHAQGLNDKSWAALMGSTAKQASEAAQLEVRRRFLNRFAIDRFRTAHDAHRAIENFEATKEGRAIAEAEGLGKLKVVHYGSGQIVASKGFQEAVDPVAAEDVLRQFGLHEHTPIGSDELGHHGIIPEHVQDRVLKHDEAMHANSDEARALQAYAKAWRRAKLNTSMPHIFGVMQEQAIRLLAEQVGPRAWAAGRKYDRGVKRLAEVDEHGFMAETAGPLGERFRALEATMGGRGAIASSGRWNDVVRKGEQFQETGNAGRVLRAGERTLNSPGARVMRAAWRGWSGLIEDGLLRAVEEASHHAHLGKALRETGLIDSYRQVLKAQGDALDALIQDRLTPNMADAVARKVNDMYGNWTQQTPRVRAFVSKWAPFGLWYLNSLRWLYRLPLTHPVKAGVLASMYRATAKKREGEGQGIGSPHPVPGFLQGTIPVDLPLVGKVKAVPSYYTPMGALGAEFGATAAEQLLPYVSSPLGALTGTNTLTHEKVRGPKGEELRPGQIALNTLAEIIAGPVPLSTQGQTLLQSGGKPYGTANWITDLAHALGAGPATVKPGTQHSLPEVLGKMISLTRLIRPAAPKGEVSSSQAGDELRQARKEAREGRSGAAQARTEIREAREAARRERAGR
jgi:hypothetical protein